jgi:hypothetical protein
MAGLTQAQQDLLMWIVETAQGDVACLRTANSPEDLLTAPDGTKRNVVPAEMVELVALGLLRQTEGDRYVVTSAGWAASVQIIDSTRRHQEPQS